MPGTVKAIVIVVVIVKRLGMTFLAIRSQKYFSRMLYLLAFHLLKGEVKAHWFRVQCCGCVVQGFRLSLVFVRVRVCVFVCMVCRVVQSGPKKPSRQSPFHLEY